jgi:hypothetical protein
MKGQQFQFGFAELKLLPPHPAGHPALEVSGAGPISEAWRAGRFPSLFVRETGLKDCPRALPAFHLVEGNDVCFGQEPTPSQV